MRISPVIIVISGIVITWLQLIGCAKEYSFEGGLPPDTIVSITPKPPAFQFGKCISCNDSFGVKSETWHLQLNNSSVCGKFTRTVIAPERTAFTFFGPYACSGDSGVILNSFWSPLVFDRDLNNVSTQRTEFYYYDTLANEFVLQAKPRQLPFTIVIESYNHQTGVAKGNCYGYAFTPKGDTVAIKNLRFSIVIP